MASPSDSLFSGVSFWLANTLPGSTRDALFELLESSGARPCSTESGVNSISEADQPATLSTVDMNKLTHIITDNWHFHERERLPEQVEVVTPHWVTRSYDLQHRQEPRFYSPDPARLLSGLCLATTEIPPKDAEWVSNIVALLGGQFRQSLTKEVTHLLSGKDAGTKYQMATTHGKTVGMKAVLPQWLYDTFQSRTLQPTRVYAWPNPLLYTVTSGVSSTANANAQASEPPVQPQSKTHQVLGGFEPTLSMYDALPAEHPTLVKLVSLSHNASVLTSSVADILPDCLRFSTLDHEDAPAQSSFAQGLRFYVASDTEMSQNVARALVQRLKGAGASDVYIASAHRKPSSVNTLKTGDAILKGAYEAEWEQKLMSADYVICRERSGWEYWVASQSEKPTGTLLWLLNTIVTAKLDSPLSNIFHYPHPQAPIEGFDKCQMTITNYTSTKRELLKKLVELMGGSVTGEMNRHTNYVVAARKEGKKVESAIKWEIPVLNHKWLAECCIRWSLVDPVNFEPGRSFLPGVDYQNTMLSDLPQNAVNAWASSSKALQSKEYAAHFLEYAREQSKKTSISVPNTLDLGESESDVGEPTASGASRPIRPSNSTPALIEDQLLSHTKNSPRKKSLAQQSSPSVLGDGKSSAKATPSGSGLGKGKDKGKGKAPRDYAMDEDDVDENRTARADPAPSSTGSRRMAAIAGADKSRANALDMNKHEKEKKRKRLSEITANQSDGDSETSITVSAKKQKPRSKAQDSDSDDDVPTITKTKSKAQMSKKSLPSSGVARKTAGTSGVSASSSGGKVKFLQTGHHMKEDLIQESDLSSAALASGSSLCVQAFEALGAKKVDDPLRCTHVIAEDIKRTVKFLSALSHGPPFVTEKWVRDSIKKGQILPVEKYLLSDPAGEEKWEMDLAQSIQRARQGPKVFDGYTFFFTDKTTPDKALLKEIIRANGGKINDAKPTRANMLPASPQNCLISSREDRKVWQPFVDADSSMAVHEGENILVSVLRQEFAPMGH